MAELILGLRFGRLRTSHPQPEYEESAGMEG
jgi:hypothetical protein